MTSPRRTAAATPFELTARAVRGDVTWATDDTADPARIVRCAEQHGVTALLWNSLEGQPGIPSALMGPISALVATEVARAAIRERELARVIGALDEAGVHAVTIKGAALAYACYEKPWLRPRTDTDILIPRHSLDRTAAALKSAGYAASADLSTGEFVSHQTAWERRDDLGLFHAVDVHWKIVNPQMLADAVTFDDLMASAQVVRAGTASLRVPHPVWSLLIACVHRLAHHQAQERLGWLYDIHLLARGLEQSDWETLRKIAEAREVSAVCAAGLEAAASYIGTPVPADTMQAMNRAGTNDASRAYTEREQRRLMILRDDLRHLARWKDRFRLLREHAFPSARFMMARYDTRYRAWLPACYVHRLVTGAWKWMRA